MWSQYYTIFFEKNFLPSQINDQTFITTDNKKSDDNLDLS